MEKKVLAFDFGASGGRAMCGTFDGDKISIEELHRCSNDPVILNGSMYWDVLRLFFEIKQGLIKAKKCGKIESIGIDTWGVDFGLIDEEGRLLENPVHYRDARTEGMIEESFKLIDKEKFYQITGNQFMDLNTAFQLLSLVKTRKELLEKADKMILMPDLFNYFLTGEKKAEYSIASTTQLLDAKKGEWSDEVIEALGIPKHIFPEIVPTGTKIGTLTDEICTELGLDKIDVMAVDTVNKRLFAGECKYHNQPVDADVYFELVKKVDNSAEIKSAFKGYTVIYGVFSKSGFTSRMTDISNSNPNLFLINETSIV